ncbi:hypothetical protein CLV91_2233 [Maribacter vaceletii]|uniref:Uncharacterized protein n=1 Tax=Maribacter vaceletii TaxID=1206816 RepID=A0A495EA05_9FLAO|nr:hypothetical protein [Maribacter vaceletii]RKR13511.1 hypothetical protein CLV91_2233 [Maribacter vaceletii]
MEAINGVTFEDWGAACGNIAQGMDVEEVCKVLGIELPVWQKTNEEWGGKLGDLMANDMSAATTYSGFFTNPKVGKFANVASDVPSIEDLLVKVPDFDVYQKIINHQTIASEHGMDAVAIIEQYDLNLQHWGQLNMHYSNYSREYLNTEHPEYEQRFREVSAIMKKWEDHWTEHYKNDAVDLGGDIDF